MSEYEKHFKMNSNDAVEYIRKKLPGYFENKPISCKEIGDGNINYIFRVQTNDKSRSLIIKQADKFTRSSGNPANTDRNRIEAEILKIQRKYAPTHVPEIYLYDPAMCCIVMEDIGDHENLRYAMLERKTFPDFASDIAEFLAETLIRTSDIVLPSKEKKSLVGRFLNPAMCDISEKLVCTEPYTDAFGSNKLLEENKQFLKDKLYMDKQLQLEAARLKMTFKTKAQSLIHGDLHTGSIFVKPDSTMVLDPEFAFYGPAGYDVGNVIAHLIFAWVNAAVSEQNDVNKKHFLSWVEKTIKETVDLFCEKAISIIEEKCIDPLLHIEGFAQWYISDIMHDAAGYTGMELNRRIIGSAKVCDITGINDIDKRVCAEQICVLIAKECMICRSSKFLDGSDYVETIKNIAKQYSI